MEWRLVGLGYEVTKTPRRPNQNFGFTTALPFPSGPKLDPPGDGLLSIPPELVQFCKNHLQQFGLRLREGIKRGWEDSLGEHAVSVS